MAMKAGGEFEDTFLILPTCYFQTYWLIEIFR